MSALHHPFIRVRRAPRPIATALALAAAAAVLAACGGNSAPPTTVSGVASKGPLNGAQVCAYAIASGAKGAPIGACATTDASGHYELNLGSFSGDLLIEASGGHYVDEASGATVALAAPLRAALAGVGGGKVGAAVTALTELAVKLAAAQSGALSGANIGAATAAVQSKFGLTDIVGTLPPDALHLPSDASAAQRSYALALAVLSQYQRGQPEGTTLIQVLQALGDCLGTSAACGALAADLDAAASAFKTAHAGFADIALPLAAIGGGSPGASPGGSSGATTGGGTGGSSGSGSSGGGTASGISTATGDLAAKLVARAMPAGLIDVNGAQPDVLFAASGKAYLYTWNFVNHGSYYYKLTTSSDGVHWSAPVKVSDIDNSYRIAANASGRMMAFGCAMSQSGNSYVTTPSLKTSIDGVSWTPVALPALAGEFCTNGGAQVYAIGNAWAIVDQRCATLGSADGINWSEGKIATTGSGVGGQYACGSGAIDQGTLYVEHGMEFVAKNQPSQLAYSSTPDGIAWTKHQVVLSPAPAVPTPFAFPPDGTVEIGDQGAGGNANIWTSTDLAAWTAGTTALPVYSYAGFYAITPAQGGAARLATSPGYQYACANGVKTATDGRHYTLSPLFAGGRCARLLYLGAANRLVVVASDAKSAPVLLSND